MIDKDLKIKANLFQKLRNNNIINAKQIINITYEQGKRLKLTREEDKMLTELCYHLTEKRNNENVRIGAKFTLVIGNLQQETSSGNYNKKEGGRTRCRKTYTIDY